MIAEKELKLGKEIFKLVMKEYHALIEKLREKDKKSYKKSV